jgi:hypothetical protein
MPLGQPTAMRSSRDITNNPDWISEQVDRLLGFEVLCKLLTADPRPIPPGSLADKIGVYKGYSHTILSDIRTRQLNG